MDVFATWGNKTCNDFCTRGEWIPVLWGRPFHFLGTLEYVSVSTTTSVDQSGFLDSEGKIRFHTDHTMVSKAALLPPSLADGEWIHNQFFLEQSPKLQAHNV